MAARSIADYYFAIRNLLPASRIAFAYGSAAYQQQGKALGKMLDFVFIVDDSKLWHGENLAMNGHHYSSLKYLGADVVSEVQRWAAGVYFNPLVDMEGRLIKYGVIDYDTCCRDMLEWNTLYISGRLHKPVILLEGDKDEGFRIAYQKNLKYALHASLLTLPETFTHEDLYLTISGLSYLGDFRMTFGEDRNKLQNIVLPHVDTFREMYDHSIQELSNVLCINGGRLQQDTSLETSQFHLKQLPKHMWDCYREASKGDPEHDTERKSIQSNVRACLVSIVKSSSYVQSLKGVLTAGVGRSTVYAADKVKKMIRSIIGM